MAGIPYCTEKGEWEFEHQGMVIGPFDNEAEAWKAADAMDDEEEPPHAQ